MEFKAFWKQKLSLILLPVAGLLICLGVNYDLLGYDAYLPKEEKIAEIQTRLDQLSQDIVQDMAGEVVPDIEERKAEFIELHNKLRVLLGKEEREVKEE